MKSLTPLHSQPTPTDENKQAAFGDVGPWLGRHGDEKVDELFKQVLTRLRNDKDVVHIGGLSVAAMSHRSPERCAGILLGWPSCPSTRWNGPRYRVGVQYTSFKPGSQASAVVANHPSFSEFPATFVDLRVPTLVQKGTGDEVRLPNR